jgi:hypothetical protein
MKSVYSAVRTEYLNIIQVNVSPSVVCQLTACHRGDACSIPGQGMWDLWWTEWHWEQVFHRLLRCCLVSTIPPVLVGVPGGGGHSHNFPFKMSVYMEFFFCGLVAMSTYFLSI